MKFPHSPMFIRRKPNHLQQTFADQAEVFGNSNSEDLPKFRLEVITLIPMFNREVIFMLLPLPVLPVLKI